MTMGAILFWRVVVASEELFETGTRKKERKERRVLKEFESEVEAEDLTCLSFRLPPSLQRVSKIPLTKVERGRRRRLCFGTTSPFS